MQINGIDEKDNLIIDLLLKDGRMSYSDMAKKVGLTRTAVKNRISALEKSGLIKGYRAVVNPLKSTGMMAFVVNIETSAQHFETAKEILADADECVTLVQTTGNCRLMAICVAPDIKTMKDFVNRVYKEVSGILSINANSVLDVVKGSVISEI